MSWYDIFRNHGMIWILRNVYYKTDSSAVNPVNVKDFLALAVEDLKTVQNRPRFKGTRDEIMLHILSWVKNHITYRHDLDVHKKIEFWQVPSQTIRLQTSDCEDGAVLIYALAILHNINPLQIKFWAGEAKVMRGVGGHASIQYRSDELFYEDKPWSWIDWCYYYDDTPFKDRIRAVDDDRYVKTWWECSHLDWS